MKKLILTLMIVISSLALSCATAGRHIRMETDMTCQTTCQGKGRAVISTTDAQATWVHGVEEPKNGEKEKK